MPMSWGQKKFPSVSPPDALPRDEVPRGHVPHAQGHCSLPQLSAAGTQDVSKRQSLSPVTAP